MVAENSSKIILASTSPRRAKLLVMLGVKFEVHTEEVDEVSLGTPLETVTENARRKAISVFEKFPGSLILAGDTVVDVDGVQIGKPPDLESARKILKFLSGKTHRVTTAVALQFPDSQIRIETAESFVAFSKLSENNIENYLKLVKVTDKAGAYGIQESGFMLAEKVDGDITNVMGLPLSATFKLFRLAHERCFI